MFFAGQNYFNVSFKILLDKKENEFINDVL